MEQEYVSPWNGGTLATAGGLVFQGAADGRLVAYDAAKGAKIWDAALGVGVVAAPMTYEMDGKQYVSIAVGWGGVFGQTARSTDHGRRARSTRSRSAARRSSLKSRATSSGRCMPGVKYDPKSSARARGVYVSNCLFCHGVPGVDKGGNIPNLGYVDCRRDR